MLSYDTAINSGCNVVETDLHISKDNQIVICHDPMTQRVFGESYDVTKENYDTTLSKLKTIQEPHLPMPTLLEELKWCREKSEKTGRNIQLMLDIKKDCDPELLLKLILADLKKVGPNVEYWKDKLIFGMWDPRYYCKEMDQFRIINITFDITIAKDVVKTIQSKGGKVSAISIIYLVLYEPGYAKELFDFCKENDIKIWFWTVNFRCDVEDAIKFCKLPDGKSLMAGIITDDPIETGSKKSAKASWSHSMSLYAKRYAYVTLLYLVHNNYNTKPIFDFMKKVGFM